MGYGFKLLKANGDVAMSTDDFGLQIVDDFTVVAGSSGYRTYSELDYFNILYAMTGTEYNNPYFHRELSSHATLDLGGSVGAGNIPTITWGPLHQLGANSCNETSSSSGWYSCNGLGCQPPAYGTLPTVRIIVMAA
jgi:hypothetical protein